MITLLGRWVISAEELHCLGDTGFVDFLPDRTEPTLLGLQHEAYLRRLGWPDTGGAELQCDAVWMCNRAISNDYLEGF